MLPKLSLILALSLPLAAIAQDPPPPAADGYVTRADASSFDINGFRILITPKTGAGLKANSFVSVGNAHELAPYLGERATVYGNRNDKAHTIQADKILLNPQAFGDVSGDGIIDWAQPANTPDRLIRADGYQILITPKTKTSFAPPLTASSPITTNLWIVFHGKQRPDGVVVADSAAFVQNSISKSENKLLDKTDYDPDSIDPEAGQSGLSRFFLGIDVTRIPPNLDPAMQKRVTEIGYRVIPQYQRNLPESDLTKIIFRFVLIDQKDIHTPVSLPSGIILVPHELVARMPDDAQLAAVLALSVAQAIEKQSWHIQQNNRKFLATGIAGDIAGAFIPGVGLLTAIGTTSTGVHLEHQRQDQVSRVSLWYLHDGGFDIDEAPRAWWLLNSKKNKDLTQIKLPRRTGVMYDQIGTTWRSAKASH